MNQLTPKRTQPDPAIAAFLSLIFLGGGGQIYLGQMKKGALLIVSSFMIFFVTIPFGIIDAYFLAKAAQGGRKIVEWDCFWDTIDFWNAFPWLHSWMYGRRKWEVVSVLPVEKQEEPIGTEKRTVDNSLVSGKKGSSSKLISAMSVNALG